MRKVKILAAVGLAVSFFVVGLALWAGFAAVKYVIASTNQLISSQTTPEQLKSAKTELQKIQLQPLNCWSKAQSLLAVQPWADKPVLENLRNLKVACLDSQPTVCVGDKCSQTEPFINTEEGRII